MRSPSVAAPYFRGPADDILGNNFNFENRHPSNFKHAAALPSRHSRAAAASLGCRLSSRESRLETLDSKVESRLSRTHPGWKRLSRVGGRARGVREVANVGRQGAEVRLGDVDQGQPLEAHRSVEVLVGWGGWPRHTNTSRG